MALLRATEALKRVKTTNEDQKHGIEIVKKAITSPARQIAINSGEDGSVVVAKGPSTRARRPCPRALLTPYMPRPLGALKCCGSFGRGSNFASMPDPIHFIFAV